MKNVDVFLRQLKRKINYREFVRQTYEIIPNIGNI
jgi:hypothetical protein